MSSVAAASRVHLKHLAFMKMRKVPSYSVSPLTLSSPDGLGNDFVIIDLRLVDDDTFLLASTDIAAIANRRTGIGCDQVTVYVHAASTYH